MGLLDAIKSVLGIGSTTLRHPPLERSRAGHRASSDHNLATVQRAGVVVGDSQRIPSTPPRGGREWIGHGQTVDVGGRHLVDPLTYWIGSAHDDQPYNPSTLLTRAAVGKRPDLSDPGYWPSYYRLSPDQRAAYLDWMAEGRVNPGVPLGFVFIYFYGLEWRALVDRQDHELVCREILRLYGIYGTNGSFHSYAGNLLGHLLLAHRGLRSDEVILSTFTKHTHKRLPAALLEGVLHHHAGKGLPLRWAWYVAQHQSGCANGVVQKQTTQEFRQLLEKRIAEAYPAGFPMPQSGNSTTLPYKWAMGMGPGTTISSTCHGFLQNEKIWEPLVEIWRKTTNDLKALAKTKSKPSSSVDTFHALPAELRVGKQHPEQARWDDWHLEEADDQGYVVTTIGALALQAGIRSEPGGRFKASALRDLYALIDGVGLALEPDPRLGGTAITAKTQRVVYRPEQGAASPGEGYQRLRLLTEVSLAVATADGKVSEDEWGHLLTHLDRSHSALPADVERLRAFSHFYALCDQARKSITKARFAPLTIPQREGLAALVVTIALADGVITDEEQKALARIYRALGLSMDRLAELVQPSSTSEQGEGIDINWDAVAKLQAETAQVQGMLANALNSSSAPDGGVAVAPRPDPKPLSKELGEKPATSGGGAAERFPDLDPRHAAILLVLGEVDEIAVDVFKAACKSEGLLPAGVLDRINEWAQENLGDELIIGDGPYTLQLNLLSKAATT